MNSNDRSRNCEESKYKGVRKRKWGKWVSEIRLPHSRDRIWLGSYDSAVKAARAFDAAQFCLRGPSASFNFPDNPPDFAGADAFSPAEIQAVASRFANRDDDDQPRPPPVEEAPTTSDSGAPVQWQSGPFYNDYDLMTMDSGSGYKYEAEFGFSSGSGEFYGPQQPDSFDYGYENWNGSGTQGSFLWNF